MEITTSSALLIALGARILLNSIFVGLDATPSTPDCLLNGLFQGVLLYTSLTQLLILVVPVGFGIAAKLLLDYSRSFDATQCVCTLLGVALGVVFTDVLSKTLEDSKTTETTKTTTRTRTTPAVPRETHEPSRRLRLVSFDRQERTRHRREEGHRHHRDSDDHERDRDRERERNPRRLEVRPITPTLTYASTAPSISLDSVPSSIDPDGRMTPQERAVAVLRARASLADSERRRFKEERKWALSQGNFARASQLAWQVKRFSALMESFHREADVKVVEAARAAAEQQQPASGTERPRRTSQSKASKRSQQAASSSVPFPGQASTSAAPDRQPLVSVTVASAPRHRKRSSGTIRPAIHVQGREINVTR
ncbi:uncharacterized protein B0H18DRAFT_975308 [Fomitopsis serialis]|uniref:uncharacterized protein n=1 Tax=Fomitopsis serialis TaxID=139415 RepID=UPI00200840A9|nr:uncharacterized protein B0H18DRAFT_975308 [Neoantrodia serialis]KAH9935315.1 hypothetical protein B0H18DRAFT_975308 [Neoantrodia serialis]